MKFADIIKIATMGVSPSDAMALVNSGYTPEDIEKLKGLEDKEPETKPLEVPQVADPINENNNKEPLPDYKKMYEDTKAILDQVQKTNINKDIPTSPKVDEKKIMADYVRNIY